MIRAPIVSAPGPGDAARPSLSLIICTKDRCASLAACLERVMALSASFRWELIVVDNGSTDNTWDFLVGFLAVFPHPYQLLHVTERGNGAGRNAAIVASRGDLLAFTDDDCYVDPMFLEETAKLFRDDRIGYVSGRILLFDPTDYPITINESCTPLLVAPGKPLGGGIVQGANMAFRKRALDQAGLFDPVFGAGAQFAGEDWELAMRVNAAGWWGGYFPQPLVQHHHGRKQKDYPGLFRFYAIGEGAVYAKGLLNPALRANVARLWLRGIVRSLVKHLSIKHIVYVATGALAYWRQRRSRRSLQRKEQP